MEAHWLRKMLSLIPGPAVYQPESRPKLPGGSHRGVVPPHCGGHLERHWGQLIADGRDDFEILAYVFHLVFCLFSSTVQGSAEGWARAPCKLSCPWSQRKPQAQSGETYSEKELPAPGREVSTPVGGSEPCRDARPFSPHTENSKGKGPQEYG